MNIALPDKFFYNLGDRNKAYVKNDILYIEGRVNFEGLMYSLTYSLKGYDRCFYCGKELEFNKRTLDHMYPRYFGGVSIPDNLVPSCPSCNSKKSSLTSTQFTSWIHLKSKRAREKNFKKMMDHNHKVYKQHFILPEEWITPCYDVSTIIQDIDFSFANNNADANLKVTLCYAKYHHYPKPIVVTSNGWVLTGFHILRHAKNNSITQVPAIVLDNVIHIIPNSK